MTQTRPVVLVTGANSGMGKATALAFAKQNAQVVMLCRNEPKGLEAQQEIIDESGNENIDLILCDFADLSDVRRFAADFTAKYDQLNVLVNNAAIITTKRQETVDGYELQFGVNHLAPFLLTNLLLDKLKASAPSRIINVSSGAYKFGNISFEDLHSRHKYRTFKVYGQSKLANILFTYELSRRLEASQVTTNCLHPGAVSTNLGIDRKTGFGKTIVKMLRPFFQTPAEGSRTAIYLATSKELEGVTGKFFVHQKEVETTKKTHDRGLAAQLWKVSEELVGISEGSNPFK
ncbi:SDR family oxidoreductase [Salipaludibacillus sp. HK11]|uniref:SDR family oxidoreductase n=1 Tax=Salipaludibacillus sp. HK11 TaxID=3394320 RepID=UPI0039FBC49C